MRKISFFLSACLALLAIYSCGDGDRIDQIDSSVPAPMPIEVIGNTPKAGGAVLQVKIPDDDNLKGVVAVYNRNGQQVETKISRYVDTLSIEGYADTLEHEVKVYAFNVNEKRSEPVIVNIRPLPASVHTVQLELIETFGGVKIHVMNNTANDDLAICLLSDTIMSDVDVPVSQKRWREVQTLYTAAKDIYLSRRNLSTIKTIFGAYIRDHWGNISDTITAVLTPWYEEAINKKNFKYYNPGDDNSVSGNSSYYPIERLWDGSGRSDYAENKYWFYASNGSCPMPQWFTIDLGVKCKLSRIATLPRIAYQIWTGSGCREFEFWGSLNPTGTTVEGNEHGFDDTWVKLGYFEQPKPSGYAADGTVGTVTQDDADYYNNGNDFELDPLTYPHANDEIRYLRVVIISTFSTHDTHATNGGIQLGEVTPYGQVTE